MSRVHFDPSTGLLIVALAGKLNLGRAIANVQEADRLAETHGAFTGVLVDLRQIYDTDVLSYPEMYRLVRALAQYPRLAKAPTAVVDVYRKGFEKAQFFESAASDKGHRVRAFVDYDAATEWLREMAPAPVRELPR